MVAESTVYTSNSEPDNTSRLTECPHCRHRFNTGTLNGEIFCIACGEKFDSTKNSASSQTDNTEEEINNISDDLKKSIRAGRTSRFGDYIILSEVARGGMGVVYKAKHKTLKRVVALKVIKSANDASNEDIKRFIQEAKAAAILRHPNIVTIHNFDVYRGLHFFTMDFIDGTPLDRILETGPLPPYKACELMRTIAQSIAYAHSQGVVHRDIKPGNVIIDHDGNPMLTDFGLAINLTSKENEDRMTKSGAIMGTLPYIAPEQASGRLEEIGTLSDIYSLGALFYELITGRPPFHGLTQFELLKQIINFYPPSPKKLIPRLSKDLDTIIMKCLEKEPNRRYQSAAELEEDCNAFLHGDIIKARPSSLIYKLQRKFMQRPAISIMFSSLILISIFTILLLNYAKGTTQQLQESQAKQEQIKKDKNLLGAMLKRDWRGEYSITFDKDARITAKLSEAQKNKIGWYNPRLCSPDSEDLVISSKKDLTGIAFGAPVNLPQVFHVNFKILEPELNNGRIRIYLDLDKNFYQKDTTRIIELGVEGSPGIRIIKGDTVLAEIGSFTLSPKQAHNISIYRDIQDNVIVVQVDNKEVIRGNSATDSIGIADSYIGIGAGNGSFKLKAMQISVLGMNQEMIKSSLRLADSLAAESKDREAARVLYKKILKERTDRATLIQAYSGFSNTLSDNPQKIIYECNSLTDSILQSRSRYLELGETDYLEGIALASSNPTQAISHFKESFNQAYRNALKDIMPENISISACFPADFKTEISELLTTATGGKYNWQIIKPLKDSSGYLNISQNIAGQSGKCYIKEFFQLNEPKHIIIYLDNNNDRLFINAKEFTDFLIDTGRSRRYAITDIPAGDNIIILEHNLANNTDNTAEKENIQLRIRDHDLKYTTVYGLLSRVEEALITFRISPDIAVKQIITLQNDHTLEYLKTYYPSEIKSRGILQLLLSNVDKMLEKPASYSNHAWVFLEAARTLADPGDGSELAIRYNKLAEQLITIGNFSQAGDLFSQAITLQPDWYLPLVNRAKLLYRQENYWYDGANALDEALKHLPNSLELRLQIAGFYLDPGYELAPDPQKRLDPIPEKSLEVAEEAVKLSKRKSPEALTICALSLELLGKNTEAVHYVQEAILLENTPERKKILDQLNSKVISSKK